jgi:RNA polymerase-binding transcription factor DksA
MDAMITGRSFDKLMKRRHEIAMTLQHLEKEQKEVEKNTDWIDRATYQSRVDLLDHLTEWYLKEIAQVEKALRRINDTDYGRCAGCHRPIEPKRLETFPEAEFCRACQDMRESLERV